MITEYTIENFGPIKKASGTLTPLHAFIGPNDSGKSSLLRALVSAANAGRGGGPWFLTGTARVRIASREGELQVGGGLGIPSAIQNAMGLMGGAQLARFEPDVMKRESQLVPEEQRFNFIANRGFGLPGIYDLLLNRNDGTFQRISGCLGQLFPSVLRLRLMAVSSAAKNLAVDLKDGTVVGAETMSEGMLFYLAYAAIRELSGLSLLAVEEPETGLHPIRIAEVMRILRGISESGTQVLLSTHNPLVINEMKPDEVSVLTRRTNEGTQVHPISETPQFEQRASIYNLGELWLSYANGIDEAPLLSGSASEKPRT